MVGKLVLALGIVLGAGATVWASNGEFAGPGPGVTGNDTGGIFPYSPAVEGIYEQMASDYCARWARFAKVTSIHRKYGDYVTFVCIDRPGMIH